MRAPTMALVAVAVSGSFLTVGCGSPGPEPDRPVWAAAAPATTAPATPRTPTATAKPTPAPRKPTTSPTPRRATPTKRSSAPPWCQLADLPGTRISWFTTGDGNLCAGPVDMLPVDVMR